MKQTLATTKLFSPSDERTQKQTDPTLYDDRARGPVMVRKVGRAKTDSKVLRERASYFRRLARGVGDPQFTLKLAALADDYEATAIEMDAQAAARTNLPTVGNRR